MPPNSTSDPALAALTANAIQNFALHSAGTADPTTLMTSLVDDAQRQREREKFELQSYFAGAGATSLEVQFLGNEKTQLAKALQQLAPNDPNKIWTFQDFQQAVDDAKVKWENKKRLGGGSVQRTFHKLMGKFKVHSNLFSLIPSANEYTSVICWAASVLVNASVQHTDTIEELANVMEVINESASMVENESKLFRGEAVQRAVAKFYTAIFLLLGDVAIWYNSNSLAKFRNSMHDGFHKQFASALQNVQRLSEAVGRTSDTAAAAEGRYTRLTVEGLRQDMQDERAGLSGELRTIAQSLIDHFAAHARRLEEQNRLDHEETRRQILAALNQQMQDTQASFKAVADSGRNLLRENVRTDIHDQFMDENRKQLLYVQRNLLTYENNSGTDKGQALQYGRQEQSILQLQSQIEKLLFYVSKGARNLNDLAEVLPHTTHERVAIALANFLESTSSTMLYLEYPSMMGNVPEISLVANRLVLSADSLRAPIISFFCGQILSQETEQNPHDYNALVGLVYSLTYQLLNLIPATGDQTWITIDADVENLDGHSWEEALHAFSKVLALMPSLMLCVIDGVEEFEAERGSEVGQLVEVLRAHVDDPSKTFKVLFTSRNRCFALLDSMQGDEIDIVDTSSHPFGVGRGGRTLFIV
ncbi:hypothetical protein PV11_01102 [Exophiala sideris]|uniref:Fungal STAND N-terminal Goodbye domain-containing protein n=1 Tax=Exophiala sideris TaxID=1016849 RepID=A0A0D1W991_9EURO|nr:hypothetical protein PV11_01102 [Exophiala sideris]